MRPSHIILSALALGANAALNHQDVPVKVNTGVVDADVNVAIRQTDDEKRALNHFEAPVKVNAGVVNADVVVATRRTTDDEALGAVVSACKNGKDEACKELEKLGRPAKRALNHFEAPVKVNTGVVNADVAVATRQTGDEKRALLHFEAPVKVNTGVVDADVKVATRQMDDEKRALNHFEAPVKVNTGVVNVDAGVTIS